MPHDPEIMGLNTDGCFAFILSVFYFYSKKYSVLIQVPQESSYLHGMRKSIKSLNAYVAVLPRAKLVLQAQIG